MSDQTVGIASAADDSGPQMRRPGQAPNYPHSDHALTATAAATDAYAKRSEITRSEAVRRLVELGLGIKERKRS